MVDEYEKQRKVYIDPKTKEEYESIVGAFTHKRIGNGQLEAVDELPKGCVLKEDYGKEVKKETKEEVEKEAPGKNKKTRRGEIKDLNKKEQVDLIEKLSSKLKIDVPRTPLLENGRIDLIMKLEGQMGEEKNVEGNSKETKKDN